MISFTGAYHAPRALHIASCGLEALRSTEQEGESLVTWASMRHPQRPVGWTERVAVLLVRPP